MRIACCQMDVRLGDPVYNFTHAAALVKRAAEKGADVVMLPETWNIGFFPKKNLAELADPDGESVRAAFSALAKERSVNIVAGSAATNRNGKVFNTAFVFNREGECVASYDKTKIAAQELQRILNAQNKEANAVEGSYAQLSQRLELLRKAYKQMTDAEKASVGGQEIEKVVIGLKDILINLACLADVVSIVPVALYEKLVMGCLLFWLLNLELFR